MPKKLKKKKIIKKAVKKGKKSPGRKAKVKKAKTKPKSKKKALRQGSGQAKKAEKPIGVVTHFFTKIKVAVIKFKAPFRAGGSVRFSGATTDFEQKLVSLQYDHEPISVAKKGQGVGVKVAKRVREGDLVFVGKK